jgi:gliding motility-associated-like protein
MESMKQLFWLIIFIAFGFFTVNAQNKSNKGKDFWVGWGHNVLPAGTTTGATSKLAIYISADITANITISIPGTTFSTITDVVNAGQVKTYQITITSIMLTTEGVILNKSIHIESDVDIVAYAHQYGQNSAGATMLMPVETYGYTYYSINYTQRSNMLASGTAGNSCYSWCYVIASEDNTKLQITPSVVTSGNKPAGITYTISLNKGEIYNFFGRYNGQSGGAYVGEDLTGSKIVSVADLNGICHPIAVFSGSSRILVNATNGGDVLQQQIFPASAWGTRYLSLPSSSATNVSIFNNNVYRVAVRNPNTIVKRNGIVITGLTRNFYYEFQSAEPEYIEADGPILVSQYFPSTSATGFQGGAGDPEMIYLSSLEQSIKKAIFYNTSQESISKNYVSVVIPYTGLASLTIDGSNTFDVVAFHPKNFNYRYVIKAVSGNAQHTIICDSGFIATTYGLGSAESYGYNAGTLINNLNIVGGVQNTFGSGATSSTCPNSPFKFSVQLAYKPSQMIWKLSQVGVSLGPVNADTTLVNPIPSDSGYVNGRKYYTYKLPREYTFSAVGTYIVPITCTAIEIDNCNNTEDVNYTLQVVPGPKADFNWAYTGCISDTVQFTGINLSPNYTINKFRWYFDDNTQDSIQNAKKKFNTQGNHPTKFRLISTTGCIGDTIKTVVTAPSPVATFGMSTQVACDSASVTFTDTSSFAGSTLNSFYWNFGNGVIINSSNNNPQTQFYGAPGIYTIKHYAGIAGGCKSDTVIKQLRIWALPSVNFGYTPGCLQDSTVQFSDSTTTIDAQTFSWSWNFGDPASGINNVSNLQNPTHKYSNYGTYPVTLQATTSNGCVNQITKPYTITGFASPIVFNVINENNLCSQSLVKLTDQAIIAQDSIYKIDIYWDVVNQPTVFDTYTNPLQNGQYTHQYPVFITPSVKSYTIKWKVYSKGGCTSEKTKIIILHAKPDLAFGLLQGKCVNTNITSIANASITNGLTGNGIYSGAGTDVAGNFNPIIAGVGYHLIKYKYTTTIGCSDSITTSINVFPKPNSKFGYKKDICLGDSIRFKDSATISTGKIKNWNWDFGDLTTLIRTDSNAFFKTYATANTFTVKLVAISDSACISDTFSLPVVVIQRPISTFTVSQRLCKDTVVTFTPTSNFGSGTILNWYWNFANTQTLNTGNSNPVTTTYLVPGNYTVKHVVNAGVGCVSDTAFQTFTIYANPVTDFTFTNGCLQDSTVTFTDATTISDAQSFTWSWNFADPNATILNPNTSLLQSPTHRYTAYGNYPVRLTTTTLNGCTNTKIKNFSVGGFLPTVNFTIANENTLCSKGLVKLTNQTPVIIDSIYKVEIYWDFIGQPTTFQTDLAPALGKVYTNQYPSFTTPANKSFTIKWKMYSKGGCIAETTKVITINAFADLSFGTLVGKCVNAGLSSVSVATINNGLTGVGTYSGAGTDSAGNFNPALAGVGYFPIKYTYVSSGGCIDSIQQFIRVFPKPSSGFIANNNICLKDSILFTDTSKIIVGTIKERYWDFGDATNAIKLNATPFYKTYAAFNTYNVKMYVVSDSACISDTVNKDITIYPLPTVAFTLPNGVCMPAGEAKFTNQSTIVNGSVTDLSYVWNFGDNTTTPVINPTHYYTNNGPFVVKLQAMSLKGCIDSLSQTLSAFYDQPIANFQIIGDTLCPNVPLLFKDLSTAPNSIVSQWIWNFGDGDTSNVQNPIKKYNTNNNYNISLIVKNPNGCISNSFSLPLTIYKQPVVDAGVNIVTPEGVSVILQTTINDPIAFKYLWTPSFYLNNDTILNPISTPIFTTTYKIYVYGGGNCYATDSVKVTALKQLTIPNVFSPNGDNIHDTWDIAFLNDYSNCKIQVFNRNGQVVFNSLGYGNPWDGRINGVPLPVGTYYYIIDLNKNGYTRLSGSVTILR